MRLLLSLTALACWPSSAFSEDITPLKDDLFTAGSDGYALYRIPGVVVTAEGSVLVYCEARKGDSGDWGSIDIYLRRSTDGGKTFSPRRRIGPIDGPIEPNPLALKQNLGGENQPTYNNPVAVVDHKTGDIHFLFCVEYMRCFYCVSRDDGLTFSKPREITDTFKAFREVYDWKVLATGPGHGIQMRNGRLVVPVWISTGTGGHAHRPSVVSVIYSDDHGDTWHAGEVAGPNVEPFRIPNETSAEQLADGRVLFNMRTESESHRRALAFSDDGATGWSDPIFHEDLLEPICFGSMARYSLETSGDRNRLLFCNPRNLERSDGREQPGKSRDRKNLTVHLSYDEAKTWPVRKTVESGTSGYSDLAVGPDGTIYCFYERGGLGANAYKTAALTLARFDLGWLTDGEDAPVRPGD